MLHYSRTYALSFAEITTRGDLYHVNTTCPCHFCRLHCPVKIMPCAQEIGFSCANTRFMSVPLPRSSACTFHVLYKLIVFTMMPFHAVLALHPCSVQQPMQSHRLPLQSSNHHFCRHAELHHLCMTLQANASPIPELIQGACCIASSLKEEPKGELSSCFPPFFSCRLSPLGAKACSRA